LPAEVTQPELPPAKPGQPVNLGTRPVAKLDQVPEPQAGQEPSLAGEPRTEGTAAVTPLDKVAAKTLVPCLAAAADGHAFYALDGGGLVRRIAWNQFKEERRIELGHKAAWLAVSAEGPVVTLPDLQEAWVLDPVSLKIKARISLPGVIRVTAAPALAYGVAVSKAAGTGPAARIPGRGGELLQIFGLKRAGTVKTYHPQDFPAHSILGLNDPVLTPDGKYLFTQDGSTLSKWQVGDGRLIYKETSERIGSGAKPAIHVSPDGAYVCLTSGGGNLRNQPNHPDPGAYGTYVYAVGDLKRPAFTITQGAYPAAVAFDPKAKLVYAQNIDTPLLAFSMAGAKSAEFKLGGGRRLENEVRQFLTHPAGGQVLVLQGDRLTFVNLGK
jgi:hypothetical protein